jgi:methionyl aminopeptidase
MINYSGDYLSVSKTKEEIKFFDEIIFNFNTLAFCNRWLNDLKIKNYSKKLKSLISLDVIKKYPPLYDVKGSFISQFEHTIFINNNGKEILS